MMAQYSIQFEMKNSIRTALVHIVTVWQVFNVNLTRINLIVFSVTVLQSDIVCCLLDFV